MTGGAGVSVAPQQLRVRQPLLQEPHCLLREVHALACRPALDVREQDRRVPGPVNVAGHQVIDPVRHDPGMDAEQQPVGDHVAEMREQAGAGRRDTAALLHRVKGAGQVGRDARGPHGAEPGQQPGEVIPGPVVSRG
jgi:hypothetical protein